MVKMFDNIILCDFDGTITDRDSMDAMVKTFCGKEKWEGIESGLLRGKLNLYDVMKEEVDLLHLSREEFDRFILENINLTPGFKDFLEWVSGKKIDFLVISGGFDHTIDLIIEKFDIGPVKYYANSVEFSGNRLRVEFPFFNDDCGNCPTCKDMIFRGCHKIYQRVILIGDGLSDCCVSRRADLVFARSHLVDFCMRNDISFQPFKDFRDIVSALSHILDQEKQGEMR